MLSRREIGLGSLVLAAEGLIAPSAAKDAEGAQSLGALAAEKGILFGASFAVHELQAPYAEQYAKIYQDDARILTSELEFKMSALRPAANKLDFFDSDKLVAFAKQSQMQVRGHTLIWNDDLPEWIRQLSKGEVEQLLEAHIMSVTERYRDSVAIWDVVNEPIGPWDNRPGNLRTGVYYDALGENYIERAFRHARKFAPGTTLVLNEAQTETDDANGETFRTSLLELLKRLKSKDTPIDAVGLQSHLKVEAPYDFAAFAQYVLQIAAMGFDIHITELDVNDSGVPGSVAQRDAAVADMYERFLGAILKVPQVKVVQCWQLSDGTSWMRDPSLAKRLGMRPNARPLPYDEAFKKKPAWDAIARALKAAPAR